MDLAIFKLPPRQWNSGEGWRFIRSGFVEAPIVVFNLNTLLSHAGTDTFPDVSGCLLVIEDMDAPLGRTERSLVHLARLGVFDKVTGVLWGRVENPDASATERSYENILKEFIPDHLPLVMDVDISHTVPMLTIGQGTKCRLDAPVEGHATVTILESMVSEI
jgi:muramoyltetrapeptide carboxypeptidase